jgi:hypothetical protein
VGGFAGNIAVAAELETAQLPPDEATKVEAAVDALPWGAPAAAPPHPDAFRYEVDLPDEPDRGTAVLGEAEMEHGMDLLRTQLKREGVIEPGRRPS